MTDATSWQRRMADYLCELKNQALMAAIGHVWTAA
jgi:hypothetical protein